MEDKALGSVSIEEYLKLEEASIEKMEYYNGFIQSMAGGTHAHSLIQTNAATALSRIFRPKGCLVHGSDLKVALEQKRFFLYPDASVFCEKPIFSQLLPNAVTNPLLIVEVLSDSTEKRDRGIKFEAYKQLLSLQQYILLSQKGPLAEVHTREEDSNWTQQLFFGLKTNIELPALNLQLPLSEIYWGVDFEPAEEAKVEEAFVHYQSQHSQRR